MELTGASALVTGGAGGLGAATVRRLSQAGMHVVIADLAEDRGQELAKEIGDDARFVRTDITDEESVRTAVDAASELGPLRVSVAAHGGPAEAACLDAMESPTRLICSGRHSRSS